MNHPPELIRQRISDTIQTRGFVGRSVRDSVLHNHQISLQKSQELWDLVMVLRDNKRARDSYIYQHWLSGSARRSRTSWATRSQERVNLHESIPFLESWQGLLDSGYEGFLDLLEDPRAGITFWMPYQRKLVKGDMWTNFLWKSKSWMSRLQRKRDGRLPSWDSDEETKRSTLALTCM